MPAITAGSAMSASPVNSARNTARTQSSPQPSSSATRATRFARTECLGNRLGCRKVKPRRAARRGTSRHIQRPFAGKRLNGESFQPWAWKMGPRRKGCHRTSSEAAASAMRRAASAE